MATDEQPRTTVDLASEPDFELGGLRVSPSACRVHGAGLDEHVEPRVMEVLVMLARAGGATVTRDQLVDACWGGRIVSEDAITRIVAKLRTLARQLHPAPFEVETIPKVGFRLVASTAVGRGVAASSAAMQPPPFWRRRVVHAAAAALALIVAVGVGLTLWRLQTSSADLGRKTMTEVIAFEARGADPALQRLSAAAGDAVIRVMSHAGMEVAPRLERPGEGTSPAGATFRIAGSLDREGDSYVANVQFLDRESGLVLWSGRFERPTNSTSGFEEEIALGVAAPLQCALEDRRRFKRPMAPSVFALYLNACDAVARQGNPQRMLAATRRLVDAAPQEPSAHSMYAIAQAQVAGMTDFAPAPQIDALRKGAQASAKRAFELDPDTPKAYLALANLAVAPGWLERERHLLRVQELDPSLGPGRIMHVGMLREVGRLNEALEAAQRGAAMGDPRILGFVQVFGTFLAAQTGDIDAARASIAEMRRNNPGLADGVELAVATWWEPDLARAREAVGRLAHSPTQRACLDTYLQSLERNRAAGVRGLLPECARTDSDWRIRLLARQGDIDGAYAEIARPIRNTRRTTMLFFYPEMKAFRADPRFMPLAKQTGLVDYWLASGRWPDFCAEPDLPYDCREAARRLGPLRRQTP